MMLTLAFWLLIANHKIAMLIKESAFLNVRPEQWKMLIRILALNAPLLAQKLSKCFTSHRHSLLESKFFWILQKVALIIDNILWFSIFYLSPKFFRIMMAFKILNDLAYSKRPFLLVDLWWKLRRCQFCNKSYYRWE